MEKDLIVVSEYCRKSEVELDFIGMLDENGLIEIYHENGVAYLSLSQLEAVERYSRMFYELSINIEGIDAIRHLLERIQLLQSELAAIKKQLHIYEMQQGRLG